MKQSIRTILHVILTLALTTTSAHANWWEGGYDCACGDDPAGEYGNTDSDGNSWTDVTNGGTNPDPYGGSSTSGTSGSTGGTSGDNGMDDFTRTPSSTGGGESPEDIAYSNMPKEDPDSVTVAEELARNPQAADIMDPDETMDFMKMMNGDDFMAGGVANPVASPESVIGMTDSQCTSSCENRDGRYGVINREYFSQVYERQKSGQLTSLSTGPLDALHNHGLANVGVPRGGVNTIEKDLDKKVRSGEWVVRMGGQKPEGYYTNQAAVSKKNILGQQKSLTVIMNSTDVKKYLNVANGDLVPGGAAYHHSVPTTAVGGVVIINSNDVIPVNLKLQDGTMMPLANLSPGSSHYESLDHEYSHAGDVALIKEVENLKALGKPVPQELQAAAGAALISMDKEYLFVPETDALSNDVVEGIKRQTHKERYYFTITEILAYSSRNTANGQVTATTADRWKNGVMGKFGVTEKQAQAVFHEIVTNDELYDVVIRPMEVGAQVLLNETPSAPSKNPYSGMSQAQTDQIFFGN